MGEDDHLTKPHNERINRLMSQTVPGMAHWSGTGPEGTRCLTCRNAKFFGWVGHGEFAALKPIRCLKYAEVMLTKSGPKFPADKASCRFYQEGGEPPKRG